MKLPTPTKNLNCLFCDKPISKYNLYSLLIKEDRLCVNCRKNMKLHHQKFEIGGLKVESFYDYDSLFKDILLQYKECYDEALKDVFLYKIDDYLKIKYFGYKVLYVPSSKKKLEERGFNHLREIFKDLGFKEIDGITMKKEITQVGKNYQERQLMIDNFTYIGKEHKKILIIDDVCTSGASILGVYKCLNKKHTRVKCIVLSKV